MQAQSVDPASSSSTSHAGPDDVFVDVPLKPIVRLEESVVNRIAAGEIIHRPSNALKELIENSLDAGSRLIRITLREGGMKLLQIQDDGCGIRPQDLPLLAERFATSKLRDFADLSQMTTFGFRGEALASISYVSASMRVVSKTRDSDCAYGACYANGGLVPPKPGQSSAPKPCAGTNGTLITAEDLFYNVPQRKRALKSAAEEYNRALDVAARYAVHYGGRGVGFVCKKASSNAADLSVSSSPSTTTLDVIRTLHGSSVSRELVQLKLSQHPELKFSVEGYISGANWSAKRTTFLCFINHRSVDCPALKRSFEALYAAYLPKGGHPWIYISLEIQPDQVDVNVHPTKREVHFLNEDEIVEEVCSLAQEVLAGANASRNFQFSQALLSGASDADQPRAAVSHAASDDNATPAVTHRNRPPQHMIRTDNSDQNLLGMGFTQMLSSQAPGEVDSSPEEDAPAQDDASVGGYRPVDVRQSVRKAPQAVAESECSLTSVRELRAQIVKVRHVALTEVLKNHTFVGVVDPTMALTLIQHETKLYLINHAAIIEEFAYQLVMRQFGSFATLKLDPPPDIRRLIRIAADLEPDIEEAGMSIDEIVERVMTILIDRAEMLEEYFSIRIDTGDATLRSIPALLPGQASMPLERLPTLMLRLGPQIDWEDEKGCFESIAREIAFAHVPFCAGSADHGQNISNTPRREMQIGEDQVETERALTAKHAKDVFDVHHVWMAAMKRTPFNAPKSLLERDVVQVANLPDLYRVFERC
ncbi:DNA mismatch repair protein-MLH1 family [Ceraceosorus bombacis]|uniref:DNA mismatch repair protein-MLH1 family n=1 Tax=Ceraceosorus bombacis TaxID=401625 RepID=A0A0P1BF72_9BASI|nr:DNA mismatch repair protein-MLH1 family [Ceraceosorus bombacis]